MAAAAGNGEWEAAMSAFEERLGPLEDIIAEMQGRSLAELRSKLNALESAKLDMTIAYSLNSLFWMYLSTRGIDPKDHPVAQELKRVQMYMQKIAKAERGDTSDEPAAGGNNDPKRPKINKDAAARVVRAGTSNSTPKRKADKARGTPKQKREKSAGGDRSSGKKAKKSKKAKK